MPTEKSRGYALLVGINDYPPSVGKLRGCLSDVDHVRDWLVAAFGPKRLAIECLKDADATRSNVVQSFRSHLGKAGPDDVVLFHYSGHGARWRAAGAFNRFYPDGRDEGLVCYDSRDPGGYDLADKELAVLLHEVAASGPHIAVLIDCCHSGSGTRAADDFTQARARFTHEVYEERPLASYLDGYYAARVQRGESLEIPASRHILLAACERVQKAWESRDHRGVFTTSLLDVLERSGKGISYADLFLRTRAAVRRYADNQTPQFETYSGFDAYSGFLGGLAARRGRRYSVYFEAGGWKADCGALHGLPTDPDKVVELALYPESEPTTLAGHAEITQLGAQKSEAQLLDLALEPTARYQGEVVSLPVPPLQVSLAGDADGVRAALEAVAASQEQTLGFELSTELEGSAGYRLLAENGRLLVREVGTGRLIQGAEGYSAAAVARLLPALKSIATWERALRLQNRATRMDADAVDFRFVEILEDGSEHVYSGEEITLDITRTGDAWREITGRLQASNGTGQVLHFALAYFSSDFGIQVPYNEQAEPTGDRFDLIVGGESSFRLTLDADERDEATHIFKLIVSTERIDDFLLVQEPVEIGRRYGAVRGDERAKGVSFGPPRKKLAHENEWFTRTIRVRLVRQLDQVSSEDRSLAGGRIIVRGHPSLKGQLSLSSVPTASRAAGTSSDFHRALERHGLELLRFSGTRGDAESILERTDISNAEVLETQPLELVLDFGLGADEYVLPLTFDGEDILLAGEPERDPEGRTRVRIDHIPDGIPDNRRALGKALKLYFLKTYLRRTDVDTLCWVEYLPDGSVTRRAQGVADQVAQARNVLLLIHGIIGDTEGMAKGLRLAVGRDGAGIDARFDLVLSYDYENLGGTIQDKARTLKIRLRDAGLHEDDQKRLTLLVHSMGGLLARWLIEREGGDRIVDHLVMCGTPNLGSAFGEIDSARNLAGVLTGWAVNAFPAFALFGAALLTLLGRSKKISPTLEQMAPESDLIAQLNASDDPGVRYTILAGDIRGYREDSDPLIARLTAKIGKGALFEALYRNAGHDIAVSTASIQGVPDPREPAPARSRVACHHMNYFLSEAGLRALAGVEW
jgi:pimeloyl-ACP methyl ester carboxylesterase